MHIAGAHWLGDYNESCHDSLSYQSLIMSCEWCSMCPLPHLCLAILTYSLLHSTIMPAQRKSRRQYNFSKEMLKILCSICSKEFKQQGFKSHEVSCKARKEKERECARAGRHYEQALLGECFTMLSQIHKAFKFDLKLLFTLHFQMNCSPDAIRIQPQKLISGQIWPAHQCCRKQQSQPTMSGFS